jgi:siroheme synthase-like protein
MTVDRSTLKFLPISLNITGCKILIIGGGKVALHKLTGIKYFSEQLTILAPEICREILQVTGLNFSIKYYEKADLESFDIIYACTNNKSVNAAIKNDSNQLGKLVNVADDPELCDFISPAIFRIEDLIVAVSSGSRNVRKAIDLRNRLKIYLQDGSVY